MSDNTERRIKLSGLWLNESKAGEKYFSGSLGSNGKLLIFKNSKKEEGSKQPDYELYLVPTTPKPEGEAKPEGGEGVPF